MKIEYKRFNRRVLLDNFLKDEFEMFDTLINRGFDFQTKEGKKYYAHSVIGLAQNLNNVFGYNLLPENCRSVGGRTTLAYVIKEEQDDQPVISLDVVEEEEGEELVIEAPVVKEPVAEDPHGIDWDYVNGLKNSSPAKKELEAYVLEKTDGKINLKRNKTIANMIVDLKEELAKL